MNATEATQHYRLAADGLPGLALSQMAPIEIGPAEARWVAVSLRMPPEAAQALKAGAHPLTWRVLREASDETVAEKSTFVVPR